MAGNRVKTQINIDQLLTMAIQGLDGLFFKAHKDKAKKLYKEIHDGRVVDFGSLTFKDDKLAPIRMKLALDHSEFVGHLTFHLFKIALQQTLRHLADKLQKKADLNVFSTENDDEIIALTPGIIQDRGQINVLVVGVAPADQVALIKLQFLDPEQFRNADAPAVEDVAQEAPSATGGESSR